MVETHLQKPEKTNNTGESNEPFVKTNFNCVGSFVRKVERNRNLECANKQISSSTKRFATLRILLECTVRWLPVRDLDLKGTAAVVRHLTSSVCGNTSLMLDVDKPVDGLLRRVVQQMFRNWESSQGWERKRTWFPASLHPVRLRLPARAQGSRKNIWTNPPTTRHAHENERITPSRKEVAAQQKSDGHRVTAGRQIGHRKRRSPPT